MKLLRKPVYALAIVGLLNSIGQSSALAQKSKPGAKKPSAAQVSVLDAELKGAISAAPKSSQFPNSNYVRLLDLGKVTIKPDGTIVAEYRETFKLFNERARDMAEVNISFNASYQTVQVIDATTIQKSGKTLRVKPEEIRTSSPYSEFAMYDDSKGVTFSMPGIEDDCIIDYRYKMVTKPMLMPGKFWQYWGFSGPEPVGVSRLSMTIPTNKPFKSKVYNNDALKPAVTRNADGSDTYVWEMKKIDPIVVEPAMPPVSDVRVWMELSSIESWQDIAKWYWGLAAPQTTTNESLKATVQKLTIGKSSPTEKARAIYDYVANRVRYVAVEIGMSAYRPHSSVGVYEKLYGDCKDKAHLLISMLGVAGIKAHPVLLKAGSRQTVSSNLPTLNAFNHCIAVAEIDGKSVWLDATAETCGFGDVPESDRGSEALIVRDGLGAFEKIPLYQPEANGGESVSKITLEPSGAALVETKTTTVGSAAQAWRQFARSITPEKRKEVMSGIAQTFSVGATVKSFDLPDGLDKTAPFVMTMTISAPNRAKKTGNLMIFPASAGSSSPDEKRNPFLREDRFHPITIEDSSRDVAETVILLPEQYEVLETPEDVKVESPLYGYERKITRAADGRSIRVTEVSLSRAGKLPSTEYAKLRSAYDAVLKAKDEQIVLRKVK